MPARKPTCNLDCPASQRGFTLRRGTTDPALNYICIMVILVQNLLWGVLMDDTVALEVVQGVFQVVNDACRDLLRVQAAVVQQQQPVWLNSCCSIIECCR